MISPAGSHFAFSSTILVFPPLQGLDWLTGGLILRQPDLDLDLPQPELRATLNRRHAAILETVGIGWADLRSVEQVHGNRVIVTDSACPADTRRIPADGLLTSMAGIALGIHVADCCPIFLVEKRHRAIGLLHSGRRGVEANIVREGLKGLLRLSGGKPAEVLAVLGPCIHGCCYDVDLVLQMERQLSVEGVGDVWCHPDCTGCRTDRYYSYRKEKGRTGRMLAWLMLNGR